MSARHKGRLRVVLCWHMHQPHYGDLVRGAYELPWTYLHATKDYLDMAAHLEAVPGARAVVNFAPTLLEQIEDYAAQVDGCLSAGRPIRDRLLAALAEPVFVRGHEEQQALIRDCLRANPQRLIEPFPPYRRLAEMARWFLERPETLIYMDEQFLSDLVTWYHLAWLGETVCRDDLRVRRLLDKGLGFTFHDRRQLLEVIGELLRDLIPRYRRLAESGRIELSVTPYAHPILPLLLDFGSAREAMPEVALPEAQGYPGGEARARWQIDRGIETFERYFGFRPTGCWPAEGGVSRRALELLEDAGFRWTATGEGVLRHSLGEAYERYGKSVEHSLCHPYRLADQGISCFFRDDELSDLIGFVYSDWHADDAVGDLLHRLEQIAEACPHRQKAVVPIILDGENAWEHYPANGYYFLRSLYERLVEHPSLELTTFSGALDERVHVAALSDLVAGSWVYGTFSTWIGDRDKNRAWDMLVEAKRRYDAAVAEGRLTGDALETATRQLALCEGSDWFWWFGDYNPADTVSDFERLYRRHLTNLYALLSEEPPEYLAHVFAHGSGAPALGGVMRHGAQPE
ncbi:MAG: glycoside hydrolase [Gammaproteobacteria bacterium]|nr:glycoside hydrolase [Gammaproteobacteria bacterium]